MAVFYHLSSTWNTEASFGQDSIKLLWLNPAHEKNSKYSHVPIYTELKVVDTAWILYAELMQFWWTEFHPRSLFLFGHWDQPEEEEPLPREHGSCSASFEKKKGRKRLSKFFFGLLVSTSSLNTTTTSRNWKKKFRRAGLLFVLLSKAIIMEDYCCCC